MKKILATSLSVVMAFCSTNFALANEFNDTSNSFAKSEIEKWSDYGVINGYNGSFRPNDYITRAEMAVIIDNIMQFEVTDENTFSDVKKDNWYYDAMRKNNTYGTIVGNNGKSRPNDNITREEAVVVICRAINIDGTTGNTNFSDDDLISSWAKTYVNSLSKQGLISGRGNNEFAPNDNITRQEVVKLIDNVINELYYAQGNYSKDVSGNVIVNEEDVTLENMTVNGNVIITAGVGNGDVNLDNITITGTLFVEGGGANSIKVTGQSNINNVVIDKVADPTIRFFVDSNANISDVSVSGNSATIIDGNGLIENVSIITNNGLTVTESAVINNMVVSNNCPITINGIIKNIIINSDNVEVSGIGEITNAIINNNNINIDMKVGNVEIADNITNIIINEKNTAQTNNNKSSSGGSGGGSSGGGSESSNVDTKAPVISSFTASDIQSNSAIISFQSDENGEYSYSVNGEYVVNEILKVGVNTISLNSLVENTDYSMVLNAKDISNNSKEYTLQFKTTKLEEVKDNDLVDENATKIVNLGFSQYVVVSFTEGNSLENCSIIVDDVDISSVVTPVSDEGDIVKWEVTSLNPANVVVKSANGFEEVKLSDNKNAVAPLLKANTSPEYFLTYGIISVFDYHLTNYDVDGNVRITSEKTTFTTDIDALTSATISFSPHAEIKDDNSGLYGVGGNVEILFNYVTDEQKLWFDGIDDNGALALVSFDENKRELNGSLKYTKSYGEHYGNPVAILNIPIGQSNFYSNGRYYVRVKTSNGATTLAPIHLVNSEVPNMILSESGAIKSGQNVHFTVENMLYGVTIPIESVTLTDPNGNVNVLEKIRDWYLFGELFVLYNDVELEDGRNNTPYKGVYTLTVYSNGFKTMTKQFNVTTGLDVSPEQRFIDITTHATTVVSGDGESSSAVTGANLLYQGDLLINALIFDDLGIGNAYANNIATRWYEDTVSYDAVFMQDGVTLYDYTYYYDATQSAYLSGEYLSFDEYISSPNTKEYLNRPYAVKEILEDNLLDETQFNGEYKGLTPPIMTLKDTDTNIINEDEIAVFTSEDESFNKYLNSITKIYMNGNWKEIDENCYVIENETLSIDFSKLNIDLGTVTIEIEATGYKNSTLVLNYEKVIEDINVSLDKDSYERGESIIIDFGSVDNGFINNLIGIKNISNDRTIFAQYVGGTDYYYAVSNEKDKITIFDDGTLFNEDMIYTIQLTANYYEPIEVSFEITSVEEIAVDTKEPPLDAPTVSIDFYGDYTLQYTSTDKEWLENITALSVNGYEYSKGSVWANNKYQVASSYRLLIGKEKFISEENIIVIKSTGYNDLTLSIMDKVATVLNNSEVLIEIPKMQEEIQDSIMEDFEEEITEEVEEVLEAN